MSIAAPITSVRERPIIFSAPMIRAILAKHKTQTRRAIKVPDWFEGHRITASVFPWSESCGFSGTPIGTHDIICSRDAGEQKFCPYGLPGDRLWVRENFYVDSIPDGRLPKERGERDDIYYPADATGKNWCCELIPECQCCDVGKPRIRPSIHMPRWASRITLEVTEVRVERVQEIDELDALAEGVEGERIVHGTMRTSDGKSVTQDWVDGSARDGFRNLWDSINADRGFGWESNPCVWCISFKLLEANK